MNKLFETEIAQNIEFRSQCCPWYKNTPNTFGQISHWIYVYIGLMTSEQIIISKDTVTLYGEKLADFVIDEELKMPVFIFNEKYDEINKIQQIFLDYIRNK